MTERTLEVVPQEERAVALFAGTPKQIVETATEMANVLKRVIDSRKLYTDIQGKKHVQVEGWTTLGAMLGVFPIIEWSRPTLDADGLPVGWEARCSVKRPDGAIIGAAAAQCTRKERMWAQRDDYALRSMAQTRATSKAMRLPLAWVMTLAGYEATPAEEMAGGTTQSARRGRTPAPEKPAPPEAAREEPDPRPAAQNGSPVGISDPQRKAIRGSLNEFFKKDEQAQAEWLQTVEPAAVVNTEVHLGDLTMDQASRIIDATNERRDGGMATAARNAPQLPRD